MNSETRRAACYGAVWTLIGLTLLGGAVVIAVSRIEASPDLLLAVGGLMLALAAMAFCTMLILRRLDEQQGYASGYRDGIADGKHLRSVTKIPAQQ